METKEEEEHRASERPVARARPRLKPALTLSSVSVPPRERLWIDINRVRYHHDCFMVSKAMIRLLRPDQTVPRDDGAVPFDDVLEEFRKKKFDGASQWPINDWISVLAKGGPKKRFQYCFNPNSSRHFLYLRGIQGHSGGNPIDPEEYIYHGGRSLEKYLETS